MNQPFVLFGKQNVHLIITWNNCFRKKQCFWHSSEQNVIRVNKSRAENLSLISRVSQLLTQSILRISLFRFFRNRFVSEIAVGDGKRAEFCVTPAERLEKESLGKKMKRRWNPRRIIKQSRAGKHAVHSMSIYRELSEFKILTPVPCHFADTAMNFPKFNLASNVKVRNFSDIITGVIFWRKLDN